MKKYLSFLTKRLRQSVKKFLFAQIAPGTKGVVVETEFGPLICDPCDGHVSRQLLKWGRYNPVEAKLYREAAAGLNSALFVGSHIGALAFQLEDCFDDVMCIEANPATYEILKKTFGCGILNTR